MKRFFAGLLALCLAAALLPAGGFAETTAVYDAAQMPVFQRTREQVVEQYNTAFAAGGSYQETNPDSYYVRMPSLEAPYDQGKLKQDTLNAMVGMTDFFRWLAGVAALKNGAVNNDPLQRAALIRNFQFAHYVDDSNKPADMDQELWDSGKVWHNILAWNYTPRGAIRGWCNEGYDLNSKQWDTLGHRYALIASEVSALDFGYSGAIAIGKAYYENTMSAPFAAFPAPGPMPTELVTVRRCAWNAELNTDLFTIKDESRVAVTVTDLSTGSAYTCTKENGMLQCYTGAATVDFVQPEPSSYLDNSYYPDGSSYSVRITGLTEKASGNAAEIRYQVDFFSMKDQMAATVRGYSLDWGTTLYLPQGLRDEASIAKITQALPASVNALTTSGKSVPVPVGAWSWDAQTASWNASADASALPGTVTDPGGVLNALRIYASEDYDYTGWLAVDEAQLGAAGMITVQRYMLGTPTVRLYQVKPDGSRVLRYTETSPNCTNDEYKATFTVDAWSYEDSGVWIAVYGVDWLGGFVAGIREIDLGCPHSETRTERTEPTCTEPGGVDTFCALCGELLQHETLPALDHDWGEASYVWAEDLSEVTATRVCKRDESHVEEETVETSSVETLAPTVEAEGERVYTAVFETEGFETQTKTVPIPKLDPSDPCADGHDWGEAAYVWSEDNETCSASHRCARCQTLEGELAHATSEVTLAPTEEADGVMTYTAVFLNPAFTTQTKTVPIPKLEPPTPVNPFDDVKDSAYYYEPVLWAVSHDPQITNGTGAATFSPEDTCTRGQVVTFLWRAKGCPEPTSTENPFKDVKTADYFYKAVLWAKEQEITNGTDATHFSPNDGCTRAQVVTFLWRAEGEPVPTSTENPFKDVPKDAYYTNAVLWAVEKGITNGTDPGKFSPNATCTRGQIVTFLYRDMA